MSTADYKKMAATIDKMATQLNQIQAFLLDLDLAVGDIRGKLDLAFTDSGSNKQPTKRREDILAFVKKEYAKDNNFFSAHIDAPKMAELVASIKPPKKSSSPDELNKKIATACWKYVREQGHREYYDKIKSAATAEPNANLPGSALADNEELYVSDIEE